MYISCDKAMIQDLKVYIVAIQKYPAVTLTLIGQCLWPYYSMFQFKVDRLVIFS